MNKELWRDAAQTFESSLMILRKDKNGWVIGFSVHPNDVPAALLSAPLGTRFQQVLFQVGDDEQPVVPEEVRTGKKATALAGELCRKTSFQNFIIGNSSTEDREDQTAEDQAAEALRKELQIDSRSELSASQEARERFRDLLKSYRAFDILEYDLESEEGESYDF